MGRLNVEIGWVHILDHKELDKELAFADITT